ncbi:hypothetical protein VTL71DRAFT_143 [Oculimacula yallundae]|uniref:Chlorophyllase n=1 Tax=Oculimacula yallundae TaxID=86028 RepID=A0ABR4D0B1_9HELO
MNRDHCPRPNLQTRTTTSSLHDDIAPQEATNSSIMKLISTIQLALASSVLGINLPRQSQPNIPAGTGPYKARYTQDATLKNHTIFAPDSSPSDLKLPERLIHVTKHTNKVIANSPVTCSTVFGTFLVEVASHGILVIADGDPDGPSNPIGPDYTLYPSPQGLVEAAAWIVKNAGTGKYANVDATRIAAAGHSCGGIQAYLASSQTDGIKYIGIFNSGVRTDSIVTKPQLEIVNTMTKPIFYFLGSPTDIAYSNGERDYTNIPASTPKWKGNFPVGHSGTFFQPHAAQFGVAASRWLEWVLRGNETSAKYFTDSSNVTGTAQGDGWDVVHAKLEDIKVAPI